jgi:2-polyprenyl-3-methyl-5-hydroxy-6-metoxy-1,4-benzoquinol methylase
MIKEWQGHMGEALCAKESFDVIDCEKCTYKHIIPIPTDEELIKVYEDEYYSEEKPLYIERMKEDLEWWNLSYDDRYDSFEELLDKDRRTILDIGSGPGLFLNRGKERGWEVTGVEPSKLAFEYSSKGLGLNIYNMFLNEDTKNDIDHFDVIHMSEVLEHIPNPKELLNIAYEKLNLGGLVCVVVPNDFNSFQIALQEVCEYDPWWVAPPHHINYFNFDSLNGLLEKAGFQVVLKESTFPIDMFLLMGKNYVEDDTIGLECHTMRKTFEMNLAKAENNNIKRKLYKTFSHFGVGREIILIGQKIEKN